MPSELVVEALTPEDLPHNIALSKSVGWPDTESEWRVMYEAALVLGVKRDGELVGQGGLGLFEASASIAKMVVAPNAQRQGIGGRGQTSNRSQRRLSDRGPRDLPKILR